MSEQTTDSADLCCEPVRQTIALARLGALEDHEQRTLLDALNHSGCVPRSEYERLRGATEDIHRRSLSSWAEDYARAERAEAERDRYREALSAIANRDWHALPRWADVWEARGVEAFHGDAFEKVARAALDGGEQ